MNDYPWFKSYHPRVPHTLQPYPESGPVDLLADNVKQNPDHTMLVFQDRRISWKEVDRASDEMAAALAFGGARVVRGKGDGRNQKQCCNQGALDH